MGGNAVAVPRGPDLVAVVSKLFFFFFQAEDGIRDLTVTGVQTCALPISFSIHCPECRTRRGHHPVRHYRAVSDPLEWHQCWDRGTLAGGDSPHHSAVRSEEHTSELQSQSNLVCRLLLEKKKRNSISSLQLIIPPIIGSLKTITVSAAYIIFRAYCN